MLFPRKCLWPATWMRHTPSARGITRFPVSTVIIPLRRGSRKQPFLHCPWQWFKFAPVLVIKRPERKIWGLSVSNQRSLDDARKVGWSLYPQPWAGHPGDQWRAITHLGRQSPLSPSASVSTTEAERPRAMWREGVWCYWCDHPLQSAMTKPWEKPKLEMQRPSGAISG